MQTIDLGTISIGGEDICGTGHLRPAAPPCPPRGGSEPSEPAATTSPAPAPVRPPVPAAPCTACGEHECPHPEGDDIYFEKCEDHKICHIGDTAMDAQGRILDLTMRLKNVCPGKRVAVGVALNEVDARGNEYPRGMKTFTVPAHRYTHCTDIPVASMRFILPEDISVSGTGDPCGCRRHFTAKVVAHYIDFNSANAAL